jgi:hypothetical protein
MQHKVPMSEIDLAALYAKAKAAFIECVSRKENKHLESEIGIALDDLLPKEQWIKIQFSGTEKASFLVEVRLELYSSTKEGLGYYCYHENESGSVIDDYLVFD